MPAFIPSGTMSSRFLTRLYQGGCANLTAVEMVSWIRGLYQHVPLRDDQVSVRGVVLTSIFFSTATCDIDRYPGRLIFIFILHRVAIRVVSYTFARRQPQRFTSRRAGMKSARATASPHSTQKIPSWGSSIGALSAGWR